MGRNDPSQQDSVVHLQVTAPYQPRRIIPFDIIVAILWAYFVLRPFGCGVPVPRVEAGICPADRHFGDLEPASGIRVRVILAISVQGARWMTRTCQSLLVTATTCPVATLVICAIMPPSPIC